MRDVAAAAAADREGEGIIFLLNLFMLAVVCTYYRVAGLFFRYKPESSTDLLAN